MINIASLYYFTLLQRLSAKYKNWVSEVLKNVSHYLQEEWLEVMKHKKIVSGYEVISFEIADVWSIQFFHRNSKSKKLYYYPSFFCDIYIKKDLLYKNADKKRVIFLLSNIFECFDEFDEKNLLIEFHKDIEDTYNHYKEYQLRYDFLNINSLTEIYRKKDIAREIQYFIQKKYRIKNMSDIKNNFPDIYRTLLFFVYNIFAMQKTLASTENKLLEIQEYEKKQWENMHIDISQERLRINKKSLEKTLSIYQKNFESFINIMMYKG